MNKKDMYVSPHIEVIEVENEGVIAASGGGGVSDMPGVDWGGGSTRSSRNGYSNASSSDLEDMINDILTIEN